MHGRGALVDGRAPTVDATRVAVVMPGVEVVGFEQLSQRAGHSDTRASPGVGPGVGGAAAEPQSFLRSARQNPGSSTPAQLRGAAVRAAAGVVAAAVGVVVRLAGHMRPQRSGHTSTTLIVKPESRRLPSQYKISSSFFVRHTSRSGPAMHGSGVDVGGRVPLAAVVMVAAANVVAGALASVVGASVVGAVAGLQLSHRAGQRSARATPGMDVVLPQPCGPGGSRPRPRQKGASATPEQLGRPCSGPGWVVLVAAADVLAGHMRPQSPGHTSTTRMAEDEASRGAPQ